MAEADNTWINGQPADSLPLPDRALDYGDGLFETLLLVDGRPLLLDLHLQRLGEGLARLGFPDCLEQVRADLESCLAEQPSGLTQVLRLTVSRGAGPRGYAPPESACPVSVIRLSPREQDWRQPMAPLRVVPVGIQLAPQPALGGLKHLNRLEQVLAMREAKAQGAEEALLCDSAGSPVCFASANLFAVREGTLYTPPIDSCGIAGTRRRAVLERWAPAAGIESRVARLSRAELAACDEVFATNSVIGLRAVASIGDQHWQGHATLDALFHEYQKEVAA